MEKVKIFVVDDNVVARGMLTRILTTQEDFQVVGEAGTGQGSVIMLDEVNPDVVLLEASVGGGMKLTDIVKEIKNFDANVKIILCTDYSSAEAVMPAAQVGADDFVTKPYKKENMFRVIREVVGQ